MTISVTTNVSSATLQTNIEIHAKGNPGDPAILFMKRPGRMDWSQIHDLQVFDENGDTVFRFTPADKLAIVYNNVLQVQDGVWQFAVANNMAFEKAQSPVAYIMASNRYGAVNTLKIGNYTISYEGTQLRLSPGVEYPVKAYPGHAAIYHNYKFFVKPYGNNTFPFEILIDGKRGVDYYGNEYFPGPSSSGDINSLSQNYVGTLVIHPLTPLVTNDTSNVISIAMSNAVVADQPPNNYPPEQQPPAQQPNPFPPAAVGIGSGLAVAFLLAMIFRGRS